MGRDGVRFDVFRRRLGDGGATTVYVVRYPRARTRLRVHHFPRLERLQHWCRHTRVREAIAGGFFVRPRGPALGEVWVGGERMYTQPFRPPFDRLRAAVSADEDGVAIAPRRELGSQPAGDLLQAGPLLVADGRIVVDHCDPEGFSTDAAHFDSDITRGRYPRTAFGVSDEHLIGVVCDGRRSNRDSGLTLHELAELLLDLDAHSAINLDGGGSSALVHRGRQWNQPYEGQDVRAEDARPVATALIFDQRQANAVGDVATALA
jgi:Phosphodiester glycosidase